MIWFGLRGFEDVWIFLGLAESLNIAFIAVRTPKATFSMSRHESHSIADSRFYFASVEWINKDCVSLYRIVVQSINYECFKVPRFSGAVSQILFICGQRYVHTRYHVSGCSVAKCCCRDICKISERNRLWKRFPLHKATQDFEDRLAILLMSTMLDTIESIVP